VAFVCEASCGAGAAAQVAHVRPLRSAIRAAFGRIRVGFEAPAQLQMEQLFRLFRLYRCSTRTLPSALDARGAQQLAGQADQAAQAAQADTRWPAGLLTSAAAELRRPSTAPPATWLAERQLKNSYSFSAAACFSLLLFRIYLTALAFQLALPSVFRAASNCVPIFK